MVLICQWNVKSLFQRLDDTKLLIKDKHIDILCLQETRLKNTDKVNIKSFKEVRQDFDGGISACGGVAIYLRNNIYYEELTIQTRLQVVAIRASIPYPVSICNLYLPDQNTDKSEVLQVLNQLPRPFLMLGDLNAHNSLWGSVSRNNNGKIIEEILLSDSHLLLNTYGIPTHFNFTSRTESVIDLALADSSLATKVLWSADEELHGSDHYPIYLKINTPKEKSSLNPKWRFHKADWNKFAGNVSFESVMEENSTLNADQIMQNINDEILLAAKMSIPQSKPSKGPVFVVPWWNKSCEDVLKQRSSAFRNYKLIPTLENWILFKKARALVKKTVRNSKSVSWARFISSINSSTPSSVVYNKIKAIQGGLTQRNVVNCLKVQNQVITDLPVIAEEIANHYEKTINLPNPDLNEFHKYKEDQEKIELNFVSNNAEDYNAPLTLSELENEIRSLKENSTPGPDLIHNKMIKNLPQIAKENLLAIFNRLWNNNEFPKQWRVAEIVPIPKPGRPSDQAKNLRPISLTSTLCKLFEKVITKRLNWFLDQQNCIAPEQSGGRKNHSTYDQLIHLQNEILTAFAKNEYLVCITFDLELAYDKIWRYGVLKQYQDWGLKGNLAKFIQNYLTDRSFYVKLNGRYKSSTKPLNNSIPQGGVISNKLFITGINQINDYVDPHIKRGLFVDDFVIYLRHKNLEYIHQQLQNTVESLETFTNKTGQKFSAEKTKAVIFTRKTKPSRIPEITYRNVPIKYYNSTKYLGLIFDSKLKWDIHLKDLKSKSIQKLNILKIVSKQHWGADRKSLLTLYRSLVRSKLDYGSMIYNSAREKTLQILNPVHNHGIRLAIGAFCSTPVLSLYVEANELPLEKRRKILTCNFALKATSLVNHPCHSTFTAPKYMDLLKTKNFKSVPIFFENLKDELHFTDLTIAKFKTTNIPPWTVCSIDLQQTNSLSKFTKKCTSAIELKNKFLEIISLQYEHHLKVYTDGSVTQDGSSCAFSIPSLGFKSGYRVHHISSIFSCELLAILKSLEYLSLNSSTFTQSNNIVILSDCKSALQAIASNNNSKHQIIPLIWELILSLKSEHNIQIEFLWCPGHSGISGNEEVDVLAKQTVTDQSVPCITNLLQTVDLQCHIQRQIKNIWKREWQQNVNNKLFQIKPELGEWKSSYNRKRTLETALARIRLGHTNLTHVYLIKREEPPLCSCGQRLTVQHIIIECPTLVALRNSIFGSSRQITLSEVLKDSPADTKKVLKFLQYSKLLKLI